MLKVRIFGVGDGDCILLELPTGRLALIDSCVPAKQTSSPALAFVKGKDLAFCCLTHPHADHVRGMTAVLQAARHVEQFWFALSDLDDVVTEWNSFPARGVSTDVGKRRESRRRGGYAELVSTFNWVFRQKHVPERPCLNVQPPRELDGVEFFVFGPSPKHSRLYKGNLKRQLDAGLLPDRRYANSLSIAVLVRYGEHLMWLLGDLPSAGSRDIPNRERHENIKADPARGFRASAIKIPHHGSKDAWFPQMSDALTRCDPSDLVVFSAAGGRQRPHREVVDYWKDSGKQVLMTYSMIESPDGKEMSGLKKRTADQRSRAPLRPQNLLLEIPLEGPIVPTSF